MVIEVWTLETQVSNPELAFRSYICRCRWLLWLTSPFSFISYFIYAWWLMFRVITGLPIIYTWNIKCVSSKIELSYAENFATFYHSMRKWNISPRLTLFSRKQISVVSYSLFAKFSQFVTNQFTGFACMLITRIHTYQRSRLRPQNTHKCWNCWERCVVFKCGRVAMGLLFSVRCPKLDLHWNTSCKVVAMLGEL